MKFGIFYELQLPRPWEAGRRAPALPERARPGRTGRPARLRLRLGGRAPLPRGILALARARGVPRRRQPAHQEHPPRPRHHAAHHQPSRPRRRDASPASTCCRTAASSSAWARAPRSPSSSRSASTWRTSARSGRRPCAAIMPMFKDEGRRAPRQVLQHPAAQRAAQAAAEAAPAAVGRLLAARDASRWRRVGHGRARLPVRLGRCRARLGARLLQRLRQAAEEARRLPDQPEHRAGLALHVRRDRRGGARAAPTAPRSSSSRCASTAQRRPPAAAPGTVNMWDEYQKWKAANPEAARSGAARRPDRLAGDDPPQAAQVRGRRNIDQVILLNQAGKNTHEHICEALELFAKEVMPEFHGAHPELLRSGSEQVLEPRDRARGDRHLGLHRPLRRHHEGHRAG